MIFPPPYENRAFMTSGTMSGTVSSVGIDGGNWYTSELENKINSFICFFLQSYISFLIIYDHTKNLTFSIIASLFFLLSPVLFNKIVMHLSLSAHWLILLGFYIEIKNELTKKIFYWTALISLSALIHFYFTIILLIFNLIIQILSFFNKKKWYTINFKN